MHPRGPLFILLFALSGGSVLAAPTTEWTYHKSTNGTRPSGTEQQYVWLMNRARSNPEVEGIWLSLIREYQVRIAIDIFDVVMPVLRNEFASLAPTPPAAFDIRLHNAAVAHSEALVAADAQNHDGQIQRVADAKFSCADFRGSVFSSSLSGIYGHAAFNIDWGGRDGTGMQPGRGHRAGLMGNYSNVGIGIVEDSDPSTGVGPEVTTINYCNARTSAADQYNRFIVGTVWGDTNGNRLYDPGEGVPGVRVMPDAGAFFAVTGAAGGYSIPVEGGATYSLTFSGALARPVTKTVAVGATSVLVPWLTFPASPAPAEIGLTGNPVTGNPVHADVRWPYFLGQPSAVESGSGLSTWTLEDSGYSELGGMLRWSQPIAADRPRQFWRVRSWSFD